MNNDIIEKNNSFLLIILFFITMISYLNGYIYFYYDKISVLINSLFMILLIVNNKNIILKEKKRYFIIFFIQSIILLLVLIFKNTGLGSILHMLIVTSMLLFSTRIKINKFIIEKLKYFLPIYLIFFVLVNKSHLNTNYIGYIFLCLFIMAVIVYNLYNKGNYLKLLFLTIIVIMFAYFYRCRTAMASCIIYYIMLTLFKGLFINKNFKKSVPYLIIFGNIFFVLLYTYMWRSGFYINLTFFVGKSLYSGRNRIWYEALNLLINNSLLGVGSKYILSSFPAYALHNMILMITVTFGIPNLILYIYNFRTFIKELFEGSRINNTYKMVMSTILIFSFVNIFESYNYWTNYNFLFLFIIVICKNIIGNYNKTELKKKEKKKIFIFEEGIDRIGGVERVISTLSNALAKNNNVKVISFYKTRSSNYFEYNKKVEIRYLTNQKVKRSVYYSHNSFKYFFYRFCEVAKDYFILNDKLAEMSNEITDDDIVICGRTDVALKIIPFINNYRKLIVRDAIHYYYQSKFKQKRIVNIFPKKVNVFIVSSDESKKVYEEKFRKSDMKIVKLYNPLGIKPVTKYNYNSKTLIAVGRYSPQKGFENLIKAFKIVSGKHKDWKLKIVGAVHSELVSLIEMYNIENSVMLIPNDKDIVSQLNSSSIFIMTSRYEGYANALVEAMACGIPTITYDWLLGVDDIIDNEKTGFVVKLKNRFEYARYIDNDNDVDNLASKITYLIENKDVCDKVSKKASLSILESRDIVKIIRNWEDIINE